MNSEQKETLRTVCIGGALFLLGFLPLPGFFPVVCFLAAYPVLSFEVLKESFENIREGEIFNEDFLMCIASIGALAMGDFKEAVFVVLFFRIGELFEDVAVDRSRETIRAMLDLRPDHAALEKDDGTVTVSPEEVGVNDVILVSPGERVPLDGTILEGETQVDTSALTGESLPRSARPGDEVCSGMINLSGVIRVRVDRPFGESTVSRILDLVENAADKKTKSEAFITKFSRVYTPAVIAAAVLCAVIPPLFFAQPWRTWIYRALMFLVVACPCALVISVPLTFYAAVGAAAKKGILIKGSSYLDTLQQVRTMVFDKTGTLTQGVFKVLEVRGIDMPEAKLTEYAALAESRSTHPIALSIRKAYGEPVDLSRVRDVRETSGKGVSAVIDGQRVIAGNAKSMEAAGIIPPALNAAGTVVHVAVNETYAGYLILGDQVKAGAADAIRDLKKLGIEKTVLLTGDKASVAAAAAKELGIDDFRAELLPDDKVRQVETLLSEGRVLAFVGDGINDAPVLTRSDIGIAMGAMGSDAAIEAADVVLMDDDPLRIADALRIARKAMRIARENIVVSLLVKAAVLLLSALGLTGMEWAAFADTGVLVLCVINALRAL